MFKVEWNKTLKAKKLNKRERFRIKMLKYKKRLKVLGLNEKEGNYYSYRSHGRPCSCWLCKGERFSRKIKHKKGHNSFKFQD